MHSWAPRSAARQANLAIVLFRPPSSPLPLPLLLPPTSQNPKSHAGSCAPLLPMSP